MSGRLSNEQRPRLTVYSYRHRGRDEWAWVCDRHRIVPTFMSESEAVVALGAHLAEEHSR